ncbi:MAG TPA: M15 family metallopeptidase, partial [Gemmatimonadaceae bacterium]|nr:M15 family metallopeptidase [Gemmatimonadaceae bacterium]
PDAPITRYIPGFEPHNPFESPITLRQLASHSSGLVREAPVGSRFDTTARSLAATVMSLDSTTLVFAPGTRVKYSDAGVATMEYVVERASREPFATYMMRHVLAPLAINESAFELTPALESRAAQGYQWTYDGRRDLVPRATHGGPGISLYTTVADLGRFMTAMFAGKAGAPLKKGFGFRVDSLDGMRELGQRGASNGFTADLRMLPNERVGVAVVTSLDASNAVVARIAAAALHAMLANRRHSAMPSWVSTSAVPAAHAARLSGRYASGDSALELTYVTAASDSDSTNAQLVERSTRGGTRGVLRLLGDTLLRDDRLGFGMRALPRGDTLIVSGTAFVRARAEAPAPAPPEIAKLVGEYGSDRSILYILEDHGAIYALVDWHYESPLTPHGDSTFTFPRGSRFDSEPVTFSLDGAGKVTGLHVGKLWFPRRAIGPASGNQLRVTPVRPIAELEREARAAAPPVEKGHHRAADLVELVKLDSTIHLEIRYATTNNFLGTRFYPEARAFLERPAAEALVRAHHRLEKMGYGILVHDSYRPWYVTKMFWDAVPADKKIFVADPSEGSRHNRGAAADVTLYELATGAPVQMVSTYDETSDRAWANYPGGTSLERWRRALLRHALEAEGFTVYHAEWWHFDYRGFQEYPILNIPFSDIGSGTPAAH